PRGDKLYYTTEALRAYIFHKQGRLEEAINLLAQITKNKTDARYLEAWGLDWLEAEGAVESLTRNVALLVFTLALNRFPEASHATLPRQREMCRYAALMDRYIRSHAAEEGMDTMLHAGLNRKAGNFDRAEAIARMALKRSPGWHNATALGLVLR